MSYKYYRNAPDSAKALDAAACAGICDMYMCMYIYMCMCIYVCVYVYVYVNIDRYIHRIWMYINTYEYIYIDINTVYECI